MLKMVCWFFFCRAIRHFSKRLHDFRYLQKLIPGKIKLSTFDWLLKCDSTSTCISQPPPIDDFYWLGKKDLLLTKHLLVVEKALLINKPKMMGSKVPKATREDLAISEIVKCFGLWPKTSKTKISVSQSNMAKFDSVGKNIKKQS